MLPPDPSKMSHTIPHGSRSIRTVLPLAFVLTTAFTLRGQPAVEWQHCLGGTAGEELYDMQPTSDGGYIAAGHASSNNGDVAGNHGGEGDGWVVKLDAAGVLEWQRCIGGGGDDAAYSAQEVGDGGYIVVGWTSSIDGDMADNHGGQDAWVMKLDGTGAPEWHRCLGGSENEHAWRVLADADGGYWLACDAWSDNGDVSFNHGGGDAWVVKLSATGSIEWQQCLGGSLGDLARSLLLTADGGAVVAGYSASDDGNISGNHGGGDAWVAKLSAYGFVQWQHCLGGSGLDRAYSVQATADSGFVVAGDTGSNDGDVSGNHGSSDIWVVKLSGNGDLQWQHCLGGSMVDFFCWSIQNDSDSGYVTAGFTQSDDGDVSGNHGAGDAWVVKLDAAGELQWQRCLGGNGSESFSSACPTTDGGYVLAGGSSSTTGDVSGNHGGYDAWVVKLLGDAEFIAPDGAPGSLLFTLQQDRTEGTAQVCTQDPEHDQVTLVDAQGRMLLHMPMTDPCQMLDLRSLRHGLYLVTLHGENGSSTQKLVVE